MLVSRICFSFRQESLSRLPCGDPICSGIISMLDSSCKWQTVAQLLVEIGYLFDRLIICAAAHRLAKLSKGHNVSLTCHIADVCQLPFMFYTGRNLYWRPASRIYVTRWVAVLADQGMGLNTVSSMKQMPIRFGCNGFRLMCS